MSHCNSFLKKTALAALLAVLVVGCKTAPKIESTQNWEGHYYNVDDLKAKTDSIVLGKNESIWVLSNHTLNRLLKNTRK